MVNASRVKKLEKSHDPLALVAHTGLSSRNTSSYYVTHPTSVVDYDDEYQQDDVQTNSEDPLASAMLLLARSITQNFSNPTNNHLRTSSNTKNQAIIQGDRVNIQSRNSGINGRNTRRAYVQEKVVEGSNAQNEIENDEAGVILTDEHNDLLFSDASRMEEIEELGANICLMARIHPTNNTSNAGPSYDSAFINLEAKLKKNVDLILKLGNSLQGMFMLGPNPLSVYDPQLKHGLGYPNPYILKQAISQCPKLYLASSLSNSEIPLNVRDIEDTLDDASKSQQKMKEKMNDLIAVANKQNCWTIDYKQINALYKDFVPQKELSAEQKYFPSSFIPSDKTPNATSSISASMPKLLKRKHFYTSPEEIQLNDFCQDQVKLIVNELQFYFEFFRKLFQRDIKEVKDVFESIESELCEIKKQNNFLKDQLLEASLKHEVEIRMLLNHEYEDNSLHADIEQVKKNSIEIQEGLQAKIKILDKDMEKLENENVSLDFKVQSLMKERDNVKIKYQKLFDSIKKTRSQSQKEIDELIDHVFEKTYAYGAIRAENQNLLSTISELKTRLKTVEKGKSVNTKFDMTNVSQNLLCVTPLNKQLFQKKMVVLKTKETHVMSKPVTLQTSPDKQRGANSNKNVIVPGMYRVVTTQESQINEAKSDFSSTGMNVASSVRRPMNRDS
ncbi:hypothetical protein Tco_0999221 [Tanacetum coccineum]